MNMGLSAADAAKETEAARQHEEHVLRLAHRIEAMRLVSQEIVDDGNCLFRAAGFQLFRDEELHLVMRHMVVNYMAEHEEEFVSYVGSGEYDEYLRRMSYAKTWGDELSLRAISMLFTVNVHVVTSEEKRWHLQYVPPNGQKCLRQIFLSYVSPTHYNCFHTVEDIQVPTYSLEEILSSATKTANLTVESSPSPPRNAVPLQPHEESCSPFASAPSDDEDAPPPPPGCPPPMGVLEMSAEDYNKIVASRKSSKASSIERGASAIVEDDPQLSLPVTRANRPIVAPHCSYEVAAGQVSCDASPTGVEAYGCGSDSCGYCTEEGSFGPFLKSTCGGDYEQPACSRATASV